MKARYAVGLAIMSSIATAGLIEGLHAQGKPRAYVIAEVEVTDPATFKNYAEGTNVIVPQAGGRFTANGGRTFVVAGAQPKRVAMVEWDSFEQAQAFYESDAYKKLTADRDKGAKFRAFVIEGLPGK